MKNLDTIDLSNLSIDGIKLLNQISDNLKVEFNALTEEIYNKTDKSIDWLVSSTLSRNPYLSEIYLNICRLLLIKEILALDENIKEVVVPNTSMKKVLEQFIGKKGYCIKVVSSNKESEKHRIGRIIIRFLRYSIKYSEYLLLKSKKRQNRIQRDKSITLIDTFFLPSMFKSGMFKDRYYNGLLSQLSEKEKKNIYFVPTLLIKKGLKKVLEISESAEENFIYKFDYLNIKDYLYAMLRPFRVKRINFNQFKFHDFEIGPILKTDFLNNISCNSSISGILNYLFFKRLKENNVQVRLIVDWFENQVIDHGFNKGVKDFFPKVKCIGYKGFIASYDYSFYTQPTHYESKSGIIPDEIAVTGRGLVPIIKKFNDKLIVYPAPAFRFQGLWNFTEIKNKEGEKIILLALPISVKESIEMIRLVIESIKYAKFENLQYHIKTHPSVDIKDLKSSFSTSDIAIFKFVKGDFKDCVGIVDIVLGKSSSTCLETLAMGIPVIIIGSQTGLTQNPIPKSVDKQIWQLCYTPNELSFAREYFLNISDEKQFKFKEIGDKIRGNYFEQVTKEKVRHFLKMDN